MRPVIDLCSYGDSDASSSESDQFRGEFGQRSRFIEFVSRAIRVRNIEIRQLCVMLRRFEF